MQKGFQYVLLTFTVPNMPNLPICFFALTFSWSKSFNSKNCYDVALKNIFKDIRWNPSNIIHSYQKSTMGIEYNLSRKNQTVIDMILSKHQTLKTLFCK